jgi:site-specific DNA recombinase
MPELQKRTTTVEKELSNLAANELVLDNRLQLLDVVSFTEKLYQNTTQLDIEDKRKIIKLLIKEILVGEDSIEIKHSIPVKEAENTDQEKSYLLCTRSDYPTLRSTFIRVNDITRFHYSRL